MSAISGEHGPTAEPLQTPTRTITTELVADLIETGGYVHPLFRPAQPEQPTPQEPAGGGPPLPGQAVLLLAGGLVEQSGVLDDAVALVELRSVRFLGMVRAGAEISVRLTPGEARATSSGRWIQEFVWLVVDGAEQSVLEATAVMLMKTQVERE